MFDEGNLLYFAPFIFKNGATPKNKYFLVVKKIGDHLLLSSLPTSQDHIPANLKLRAGAYEIPEKGLSAYVFLAGKEIATDPTTSSRFAFPKNTFIYGEQLDSFPESSLRSQIDSGTTKVSIVGVMDSCILDEIKQFFKNSLHVFP